MTVLILGEERVHWRDALEKASANGKIRKGDVEREIAPGRLDVAFAVS
jgi:hypothetical protein